MKIKYIALVLILLGIDQVTKLWTRISLSELGSIPVIQDFFHLTYVENRGAAFGMLEGKSSFFLIVGLVSIGLLLYYGKTQKNNPKINLLNIIQSLIIAGAIGNILDRWFLGFVTDMIDFRGIWPYVFNIADVFVVCGTLSLILFLIKYDSDVKTNKITNKN